MTEAKFATLCRAPAKAEGAATTQVGPKILSVLAHIIMMGALSSQQSGGSATATGGSPSTNGSTTPLASSYPATPTNGPSSPSSTNEVGWLTLYITRLLFLLIVEQ
jgi:hypothetical protein